MTDDATLSDFSSPGSEADESDTGGESTESSKAPARADDQTDDELENTIEEPEHNVEAPRTTFAWGSYTCGRCEAAMERAWRVDGEFVCPACKPW